jgi:hypothetical protein
MRGTNNPEAGKPPGEKIMDDFQIPPEILEHSRGTTTFDSVEQVHSVSGVAAYQCKLYRARLGLASASQHAKLSFVQNQVQKPQWGNC